MLLVINKLVTNLSTFKELTNYARASSIKASRMISYRSHFLKRKPKSSVPLQTLELRTLLHMLHLFRQIIKSRMAVHFVVGRIEKRLRIFGGRMEVFGFDDPDAHAFVAAGIDVAGVFNRHCRVGSMQAADMFVAKPLFGTDEYFPERPVFHNYLSLKSLKFEKFLESIGWSCWCVFVQNGREDTHAVRVFWKNVLLPTTLTILV